MRFGNSGNFHLDPVCPVYKTASTLGPPAAGMTEDGVRMPVLESDAVLTEAEIEAVVGGAICGGVCGTVTDLAVARVAFVTSFVP